MVWESVLLCGHEFGFCSKGGRHKCGRGKKHKKTGGDKRHWCKKCGARG